MDEYVLSIQIFWNSSHNTHFFYDSHFSTKYKSECCGAIIDNRSYPPIFVLDKTDRRRNNTLKNMLKNVFEGTCIVKYAFKVTSHDSPEHITDIYLL